MQLQKMTERLSLIKRLEECELELSLAGEFESEKLANCCQRLTEHNIPQSWYTGLIGVQKELLYNERFFFILPILTKITAARRAFDGHLQILHENNKTAMDFPVGRLASSIACTINKKDVFYDYLLYFSGLRTSKDQKNTIVMNLSSYQGVLTTPLAELSESERMLFAEPFLDYAASKTDIDKILPMLARQPDLLALIRYFFDNDTPVDLEPRHYESLARDPEKILKKLKVLFGMMKKESWYIDRFLYLWLSNNCPLHELETVIRKAAGMDAEQLAEAFSTRSSYIGLIYGKNVANIPLSEAAPYQEDILIYAITNKKQSFLRLLAENFETFLELDAASVLFEPAFYGRFVNLNSLSPKNLLDCHKMYRQKMPFNALDESRMYTFEEFKALYDLPEQYVKLYNKLSIPRSDGRLIVLRQLAKQNLLAETTGELRLEILADKLSEKPLSVWMEKDFAHIDGLKPGDAVRLLVYLTEIEKLVPQMKTRTDLVLVLRNMADAQNYDTIEELKGNIIKIDAAWRRLTGSMEFSEQFLQQNHERIIDFLCRDGAQIAGTYYDNLTNGQREAMKRIVKAELMGEFHTLKYYADDLRKEIDYPIDRTQKAVWSENTELADGRVTVREHDDFYSTMLLGTTPQRTCLSYIDGMYKECLMSAFDSNKKVLYAYMDGKIVSRAVIRLTKGKFSEDKQMDDEATLSFVDLEAPESSGSERDHRRGKEYLTLFVEKMYSAGISAETELYIREMFISLMEEKATQMGAMLVLSNLYGKTKGYTKTYYYVYISRSKAGAQYLDSLNGSATVSDEGGYKSNNFYIRSDDILKQGG